MAGKRSTETTLWVVSKDITCSKDVESGIASLKVLFPVFKKFR